jgi:hypothetical protein
MKEGGCGDETNEVKQRCHDDEEKAPKRKREGAGGVGEDRGGGRDGGGEVGKGFPIGFKLTKTAAHARDATTTSVNRVG